MFPKNVAEGIRPVLCVRLFSTIATCVEGSVQVVTGIFLRSAYPKQSIWELYEHMSVYFLGVVSLRAKATVRVYVVGVKVHLFGHVQ